MDALVMVMFLVWALFYWTEKPHNKGKVIGGVFVVVLFLFVFLFSYEVRITDTYKARNVGDTIFAEPEWVIETAYRYPYSVRKNYTTVLTVKGIQYGDKGKTEGVN